MKKIFILTIACACLWSNITPALADSSSTMMELLTTSASTPADQRKVVLNRAKTNYLQKLEMIQTESMLMDLATNPYKDPTQTRPIS